MAIKDYLSKQSIKNGGTILKAAYTGFSDDMALKLALH
jgi:membrane protein